VKLFDDYLKENINFLTASLALIILVEATFITSLFLPEILSPVKERIKVPSKKVEIATLALNPSVAGYKLGESFDVDVYLDTGGAKTVGTDLIVSYDKIKFEVVDSDSGKDGTQIKSGDLYDTIVSNEVKSGKIYFAAVSSPGKNRFSGSGTLASIKFKAKAAGEALVQIESVVGATTDSNVVTEKAADILSKVVNAEYTITE